MGINTLLLIFERRFDGDVLKMKDSSLRRRFADEELRFKEEK